jgi:hypothetical protein
MISGKDCFEKYGFGYDIESTDLNEQLQFERKYMTLYDIPTAMEIGAIPKRVYCNKDLVKPLDDAFKHLIERNLIDELKTYDGCFNPRPIRGYYTRFNEAIKNNDIDEAIRLLSLHTWGIAVDVNSAWNRLGKTPTLTEDFVQCFLDAGFDWGGNFKRFDGMHFQLAKII